MATKKRKATNSDKVFVRGADGSLYILTKNKPPYKLKRAEAEKVERMLEDLRGELEKRLKVETSNFGSMVNIFIPPFPFLP